jgi:quercetin dioxygenase-like cupin family protein
MQHYQWSGIPVDNMNDLVTRQVIHGETMTIARLLLRKGAFVGLHSHPNEQISTIESGSLRFEVGGKEITVKAGETLVIPPNVPHLAEAHEDCVATDVFSPVRQDWIDGNDAYLRGGKK